MTPGQILYQIYHRPIGRVKRSFRNGGPWVEIATELNRREMEKAAASIPSLPSFAGPVRHVHLMTGHRFWYQTAFCLHSLAHTAKANLAAEIYDDGTIDDECAARLQALGNGIRIHPIGELRAKLDNHLPAGRFPALRERWLNYPNIRKLIDVHLGSTGWKLVLDSDLLFFRRPDALLGWLDRPDCILHAVDVEESYGYSRGLLETLASATLPPLLNVGICGLRSEALDWERLEAWTAELHAREKTNYYLEQALVAMLAAMQPAAALSATDYVTLPSRQETMRPQAVMHHYVAAAKRWYFRYGWRHWSVAPHKTQTP